ncbi:hypothetical protein PNOK_0478800 [Pyrrhoderma noxium]|uniref:Histone chaperone domain-containing protein n=1 Tax=Pyrrhoderma noxium TaxID=2282107 RepID=A0A286UK48_9AGAM|nr:hypothetical protein PNOK_0478800 [Pyrrhoderma noxium]
MAGEFDSEYKPDTVAIEPEDYDSGSAANFAAQDRETAQSESTGRIPRNEMKDLMDDAGDATERSGRRQNRGGDAYKQERQLDQDLADEGAI